MQVIIGVLVADLREYTNGLIRQYIPKKERFSKFSDCNIEKFQHKLIEDQENCLTLKIQKIGSFH
jgi:IS30 family transposase